RTLERLGPVADAPYLMLQTARLRGWLAERQNQTDRALAFYAEAADTPVTLDDAPFYRALLNLSYGRLLRALGRHGQATHRLQTPPPATPHHTQPSASPPRPGPRGGTTRQSCQSRQTACARQTNRSRPSRVRRATTNEPTRRTGTRRQPAGCEGPFRERCFRT